MEFRMLGPLEVQGDEGPLPVRGRHHPKLLAMLLDEANRVVPVDRLIAGLWEDLPPDSARQQVQNVVGGLRKQLGRAGERLHTVGHGYRFEVEPGELDVLRCRERETRARRLRADGRPEAAAAELRRALGEWRGPVLAGLEGRMVEAAARRLDEYRLALAEQRNDIELDLGHDDGLVAELRQLTAAEPLRQRFTEQLMTALHRTGRTPEALQVYADFRERLAERLGADPGPSLRDLHTAILREHPEPEAEALAPADQPLVVPAMMPPGTAAFTGRREHLEALDALLDNEVEDVKLAAITGTGGVGKTTLVLRWAKRAADRFPDGQLFIDLRGFDPHDAALDSGEAVRILLEALGVPHQRIPALPQARFGLYRSLMAGRRTLVVLDNAADAAQVRPLVPGGRGNLTLVTSRNPLHGLVAAQGARLQPVREMSTDEAHALLERRLGKARLFAEPEAVDRIIERCARLPLALAIAGARATARPDFSLAALARELDAADSGLDAFAGDDPATDIRTVFACSYRALGTETARLFRLLGLHPGPDATAPVAASLVAVPVPQARRALAELADAHLLIEHEPGRYAFHDLLRAYAVELARTEDETERREATHRMLDHYVQTACLAALAVKPERDPIALDPVRPGVAPEPMADAEQASAWLTAERRTLLAAVDLAAALGFDAAVWRLAWGFMEFAYRQGYWHDGLAVQHAGLDAAERQGDVPGQIYMRRLLATVHLTLNDHERARAHAERALELCDQTGDPMALAQIHLHLGYLHEAENEYGDALCEARRALDIVRELGNERWQGMALSAVGWFSAQLERYEEALESCELALSIHNRLDAKLGQISTWDSIGFVHHCQGRLHRAVECYRKSLDLSREVGHRRLQAEAWDHLGDVHKDLGDATTARDAWREALKVLDDFGSLTRVQSIREKLRGS